MKIPDCGVLANVLAAPAPDFFFKRLRLWLLFISQVAPALAPGIFFQAAPAPATAPRGQKNPATAPDYWLSLGKYYFPHKLKVQFPYAFNLPAGLRSWLIF